MKKLRMYFVKLNDVAYLDSDNAVFSVNDVHETSMALESGWTDRADAEAVAEELDGKVCELAMVEFF